MLPGPTGALGGTLALRLLCHSGLGLCCDTLRPTLELRAPVAGSDAGDAAAAALAPAPPAPLAPLPGVAGLGWLGCGVEGVPPPGFEFGAR